MNDYERLSESWEKEFNNFRLLLLCFQQIIPGVVRVRNGCLREIPG